MSGSITVAVCTWNRASLLDRVLAAMTELVVPPGLRWELLVVDNGSTDHTREVLARFVDRLPLRVVEELAPGLSNARNAAVRNATGDYIIWTDDDVLVDSGWLAAYERAFRRWPEASIFGGPIAPSFELPSPGWVEEALPAIQNAWALLDLGPLPVALHGERLPYGANYAIRTAEQRGREYDPRLGRCRTHLRAGEEAALLHQLLEDGAVGRWVPEARVRHVIPRSRQTIAYLRSYYVGNVPWRPAAYATRGGKLLARPLWVWRQVLQHEVLYWFTRLFRPPAVWARHLRLASSARGMLLADWTVPTAVADERGAEAAVVVELNR